MNSKSIIFLFMAIGSTLGGFIPVLWGDGGLSFSSVLFSAIGAIFGIYIGYKFSN